MVCAFRKYNSYCVYFRRLLLFLALMILLFICSTITVNAMEYDSGKCGNNLTYSITGDNKDNLTLTISGTGDMWDFNGGGSSGGNSPWYNYAERIKTINIEEGITSIGDYAFDRGGWSSWIYKAGISFPSSLKRIGDRAFCGADIYGNLVIPEGVTYIGESAFSHCNALNGYISLPDSLTTLGYKAFYFGDSGELCNITGALKLPKNLKIIPGYAFCGCYNLTSVTFGPAVTSIGEYAFSKCTGIKNVSFPNTLNLIDQYAFYETAISGTITMPASVAQIKSYAFYKTDLKEVHFLGNAPTENGDAFDGSVKVFFKRNALGFTYPTWHGYNSDSDRIKVTNIKITSSKQTVYKGDTVIFTAVIEPSNADNKDVSWTLNGNSVGNSSSFSYKFTSSGTYRIQVVAADGDFRAMCTITVLEKTNNGSGAGIAKVGDRITYKNAVYAITKLPSGSKSGTAKLVSVVKNKTSIVVPGSFKYHGKAYKITAIDAGACKNNKKITSFTVGANITSIGENAFNGCTKLKKWTVKTSKLKKMGRNALKNTPKNAVFNVPNSEKYLYRALFIVAGAGRSIKVK